MMHPWRSFWGVFVVCLLCVFPSVTCASDPLTSQRTFRCMRPFSALARFSASAMRGTEPCHFGPFRVANASASVRCVMDSDMIADDTQRTCRVQLRVDFRTDSDFAEDDILPDAYRFALHLRAGTGEEVRYKGWDGNGYSVCCDLIQGAQCKWETESVTNEGETRREAFITYCPLHDKVAMRSGSAFVGVIDKPLLRPIETDWRAHLEFWRTDRDGKNVLGRVLVFFQLTKYDIVSTQVAEMETSASAVGSALMTKATETDGDL